MSIYERLKYSIGLIAAPLYIYNYCTNNQLFYVHLTIISVIFYEYYNCIKFYIKKSNYNKDLIKNLIYINLYSIIWLCPFIFTYLNIHSYDFNRIILLKFYTMIALSDSLQLFFGKKINYLLNYKPFPSISPNKTYTGYICGVSVTYLINYYILYIQYSFILLIFGIIGDLTASYIKRLLKIKDFSNILGPHGGILDRYDSFTFSAPFFVYFCNDLY